MAPVNLDNISNDDLFMIKDWLVAIVADELAAWRHKYWGVHDTEDTTKLRRSLLHLSSITPAFRKTLVHRPYPLFKSITITKKYNDEEMSRITELLASSKLLKECLESLKFTPETWSKNTKSRWYRPLVNTEFQSVDRLLTSFRGLANVRFLHFVMPHGFITGMRTAMNKARPALFPQVTTVTMSLSSAFVLKQCPKVEMLVIRKSWDLNFGRSDMDDDVPINFHKQISKLRPILMALPGHGKSIKTVAFGANFRELHMSMVEDLADIMPMVQKLKFYCRINASPEDLAKVLLRFEDLQEVQFEHLLKAFNEGSLSNDIEHLPISILAFGVDVEEYERLCVDVAKSLLPYLRKLRKIAFRGVEDGDRKRIVLSTTFDAEGMIDDINLQFDEEGFRNA